MQPGTKKFAVNSRGMGIRLKINSTYHNHKSNSLPVSFLLFLLSLSLSPSPSFPSSSPHSLPLHPPLPPPHPPSLSPPPSPPPGLQTPVPPPPAHWPLPFRPSLTLPPEPGGEGRGWNRGFTPQQFRPELWRGGGLAHWASEAGGWIFHFPFSCWTPALPSLLHHCPC